MGRTDAAVRRRSRDSTPGMLSAVAPASSSHGAAGSNANVTAKNAGAAMEATVNEYWNAAS